MNSRRPTRCSPTEHQLHPNPPGLFLTAASAGLVGAADLIISFDWIDRAGTLPAAADHGHPSAARVISCTTDSALHNGWSMDSFGYKPVDRSVPADPDLLVRALLEADGPAKPSEWPALAPETVTAAASVVAKASHWGSDIFMHGLAEALHEALADAPAGLVRLPLGWVGADPEAGHPLDYLGQDGGAGIASGQRAWGRLAV